jgi:tetratricopeptide (TPR) repeat protein
MKHTGKFTTCLLLLFLISGTFTFPSTLAGGTASADSLEASLKLVSNPGRKLQILLPLAEQLATSNHEKAIVYAREALRLAESLADQESIISANIILANLYRRAGDLKKAMNCGQKAMDLAKGMKKDGEYFDAACLVGYIYDELGDYDQSTELFFNCLKQSEKMGDRKRIARAVYGIGYTCFSQNNFSKSLEYYQKALAISREIGDTSVIAGCLNNISAVYGSQNDTQYIEQYVREAIAINLKMKNLHWVSINYGNLGSYYLDRNQYDSAFTYFEKSYDIAVGIGNAAQMAATSYLLAGFYIKTGDPGSGLKWALKALELGEKFGLKKKVYETTQLLRDIYLKKNNLALAYHYDTLGYIMKDSLNLDANNTLMSKLELRYQLEKSAQDKQLEETRRLAAVIIVLSVLVALILVILLLYVRHRLKSKYLRLEKEKLEAELDFRNKELASNVMSLMKKNEILSEITQRLIDLQKLSLKDETRKSIEHIALDLQKTMEVGIWDEFELRFRQVHTDFYEKLLQKYPDLSPNEQKLCAFLRLNMTNKEISELTGQSIKALETARYRLRIKFGISNSQVNLITLLSSI